MKGVETSSEEENLVIIYQLPLDYSAIDFLQKKMMLPQTVC